MDDHRVELALPESLAIVSLICFACGTIAATGFVVIGVVHLLRDGFWSSLGDVCIALICIPMALGGLSGTGAMFRACGEGPYLDSAGLHLPRGMTRWLLVPWSSIGTLHWRDQMTAEFALMHACGDRGETQVEMTLYAKQADSLQQALHRYRPEVAWPSYCDAPAPTSDS